jgi:hypothetical protein
MIDLYLKTDDQETMYEVLVAANLLIIVDDQYIPVYGVNLDVIGQITNVTANTGSTQTGTISYKLFFDGIVDQTKNYFEETNKFVSSVINEYGLGVLKQLSSERDYSEGKINDLQGPSIDTIIFGKLVDWESKINGVGTILKQHILIPEKY